MHEGGGPAEAAAGEVDGEDEGDDGDDEEERADEVDAAELGAGLCFDDRCAIRLSSGVLKTIAHECDGDEHQRRLAQERPPPSHAVRQEPSHRPAEASSRRRDHVDVASPARNLDLGHQIRDEDRDDDGHPRAAQSADHTAENQLAHGLAHPAEDGADGEDHIADEQDLFPPEDVAQFPDQRLHGACAQGVCCRQPTCVLQRGELGGYGADAGDDQCSLGIGDEDAEEEEEEDGDDALGRVFGADLAVFDGGDGGDGAREGVGAFAGFDVGFDVGFKEVRLLGWCDGVVLDVVGRACPYHGGR